MIGITISDLNTGRKEIRTRTKLKIVFLFFIITVLSLGCIESQKSPVPNETKMATLEPTPEQKYNETKRLEFNDIFKTWSRGYEAKDVNYTSTKNKPYFMLITNYSAWIAFLNEQDYFSGGLDGSLFPGPKGLPETIEPADFNNYFIITAMRDVQGRLEYEIEIKNISRLNKVVNVTVGLYDPVGYGSSVLSRPYHIVIVKRELLPVGNYTFVFIDTEGKLLGKFEVNE